MEDSRSQISEESITFLKNLFLQKSYPENTIILQQKYQFTWNELSFSFSLPLIIIYQEKCLLILDYHPSKRSLGHLERPLVAIARLFFNPSPNFAILTNGEDFHLIEVYPLRIKKGKSEIIPTFSELLSYKPSETKSFSKEVEEKILAFYLCDG
ncbi:MAG: hypothetical protein ACK4FM_00085 [Caldimicrobium sp.]